MKNEPFGFHFFFFLLITFLGFGGVIITSFILVPTDGSGPKDILELWVIMTVIAGLSLTHLFFSIRSANREFELRKKYGDILGYLLAGIVYQNDALLNKRLLLRFIDEVRSEPATYETYLQGLNRQTQAAISDCCQQEIKQIQIDLAKELSSVTSEGEVLDPERINAVLEAISDLEQICQFCENA
jgi:hypothetical protein